MTNTTIVRRPQRGIGLAARWLGAGAVVLAVAAAAVPAQAQGRHGHGHGGMGGPGMALFAGSPERIDRAVDHMLNGLNATDAQRSQIKQIATAAAADLKAQHESARALRDQSAAIFSAPTVDARAAEALRQQQLAQHDQASKRILQAMLDVSNVLTAEQRATLGERIKERRTMREQRMQRWHGSQQRQ